MSHLDQDTKNPGSKSKLRILLVDDEHCMLRLLERSLRAFDVTSVDRVERAQSLLSGGHFDVVISDNSMPGKTGVELLQFVAEHAPRVRRVMHSGGRPEDLEQLRAAGVIELFVTKPGFAALSDFCDTVVGDTD